MKIMKTKLFSLLMVLAVVISCITDKKEKSEKQNIDQTIYFGGDIITMEGRSNLRVC